MRISFHSIFGALIGSILWVGAIPTKSAAQEKKTTEVETDHVLDVAFSPDGKRIAGGGFGKTIHIWDPTTGVTVWRLEGPTKTTRTVAFSADGKWVAAGGDDGIVRLWDVQTGKVALIWNGHYEMIYSL